MIPSSVVTNGCYGHIFELPLWSRWVDNVTPDLRSDDLRRRACFGELQTASARLSPGFYAQYLVATRYLGAPP